MKRSPTHCREYWIWKAMKSRCTRPRAPDYSRYGGRGIRVCDQWLNSFAQFLADVGPRPSRSHSLDRIDNDGPYSPENVRWASTTEQANNKRNTRYVDYRGNTMSVAEAVAAAGEIVTRENAICRLNNGWAVDAAVETPPLFRRDPATRKVIRGRHMTRKSMEASLSSAAE